ncbi:hypothetical protein [Telluribacter sp. SYSU D00476]|uniref:hypothetical protein n=1 Tax=Telluribacter sp. SYSU D00476 TaxID=2811430 RepID=UPI001FF51A26|nr:hypothetical protein [Telluribacter sp. SYSU D00476]
MKKLINIFGLLIALITITSCEKDYGVFNSDNIAPIPVTFPNATTHGFDPFIRVSLAANDPIRFELSIPESSGRTIKEITKVAAGANAINIATLNTGANYLSAPIPGEGTKAVFTTTIAEFQTKRRTATTPVAAGQELAFIFLVTLDDNTQIVTQRVRVNVIQ